MGALPADAAVALTLKKALLNCYYPTATIKCDGTAVYRSQAARDLACLLDIDKTVATWNSLPIALAVGEVMHIPDFGMEDHKGNRVLVDAYDPECLLDEIPIYEAAKAAGYEFRNYTRAEIYGGARLRNAKDLLRYGNFDATLGDRIRLLGALSESGALTVTDCLSVMRDGNPVAALASLTLRGYVEMEMDEQPIGPETMVRRIRD